MNILAVKMLLSYTLINMYDKEKIDHIKKWLGTGSIDIFGLPFAGKDSQCHRLVDAIGGNFVISGDIFRNSNMPERVKECMRTGKLVLTEDFINIVLPYFSQQKFDNQSLILSSVGRWHGEEDGVIAALNQSSHPLKAVIYLDIPTKESHERWQAREIYNDRVGRLDDTEETLQTRFREFQEKTMPVIEYYRNQGILIEIDGRRSRDEVGKDIIDSIYSFSVK